jgi:hypothetical protein
MRLECMAGRRLPQPKSSNYPELIKCRFIGNTEKGSHQPTNLLRSLFNGLLLQTQAKDRDVLLHTNLGDFAGGDVLP